MRRVAIARADAVETCCAQMMPNSEANPCGLDRIGGAELLGLNDRGGGRHGLGNDVHIGADNHGHLGRIK